ncbi:winged helix-turn-helix transcriptional regulator [Catellatospora sichuanensis]|uniref:winged helix-turn-helix transcriptional regulator n=1 Tax=Catellatospora sichuanensis TaxID=1969805 RepID=UPI001182705B|nr:winged helix-turn-helix transcriptional regulator [Catellatospora sichuanensis]
MIKPRDDETCGIAQAAAVIGDWWSLLILREIARGHRRFDQLAAELPISRKVLTERLGHLVEHDVVQRQPYQSNPVRHEYLLTPAGHGLLPVLVSMQDWADRYVLGDGTLTATAPGGDADREAARARALPGSRVPAGLTLPSTRGNTGDVVGDTDLTVLFTYPATGASVPPGWSRIPGALGCTLENRLFRDAWAHFIQAGATVHGVSTQRPDEQAAFADAEQIPFPLLSDVDLEFAAALRLPTFRAAQQIRHKRIILVVDRDRVVRHSIYPVTDIPSAVSEVLELARGAA